MIFCVDVIRPVILRDVLKVSNAAFACDGKIKVTVMELPGEKLMIKLWETLSEKGIGAWLRPGQQRREGLAALAVKRAELLTLAQAAREVEEIRSGAKSLSDFNLKLQFSSEKPLRQIAARVEPTINVAGLIEQSHDRAVLDSVRKEINVAKSILHAEEKIQRDDGADIPDGKVNDDWIYRWRDYAGDVNSDEMQRLWGSLLAGEVKEPGTYSLRCMEFLRNLEQSEAKLIETACERVVDGIVLMNPTLDGHLSFSQLLELDTLGIISGVSGGGVYRTLSSKDGKPWTRIMFANDRCLYAKHPDPKGTATMSGYILTRLGEQMQSLGSFKSDIDFLKGFGRLLVAQGCSVGIAEYVRASDGEVSYYNAIEVEE